MKTKDSSTVELRHTAKRDFKIHVKKGNIRYFSFSDPAEAGEKIPPFVNRVFHGCEQTHVREER